MNLSGDQLWSGELRRAPIPPGRDPFINTSLLALGKGKDGEERFWISSWNSNSGSTGVLVTESGKERVYRFAPPNNGFYSAAQEDEDTLWLCGNLSRVVRLTLSTGEIEVYETGAPSALVFQGMALDPVSGKLFAAAYPPPKTTAFSFDYRNRAPVKVYDDVCKELYMCCSFPNGDGSYSIGINTPGISLLRWDPSKETVEAAVLRRKSEDATVHEEGNGFRRSISDEQGHRYFPQLGWYNPLTREISASGPKPERESTWFASQGGYAWGATEENSAVQIMLWEFASGRVSNLCTIPDGDTGSVNVTSSGKIVAVNLYGEFYRFDGKSGTLEISKRLPTDSIGRVDCLIRIDRDRLLGTPFITQRFWEVNLQTGIGYDCGRAAPGRGEVLQTWKVGENIYMASYTGGELVEYTPGEHPHFPENPRVVATPPGGMRPVAAAQDGEGNIYYSCSHHYGHLGCILTRYDSHSREASYLDDPIPGQMVRSLVYDAGSRALLVGTTMEADCQSCPPDSPLCYFARIDQVSLKADRTFAAPEGTITATVCGPMGDSRYLCTVSGHYPDNIGTRWFVMSAADPGVPALESMEPLPDQTNKLISTCKAGLFILRIQSRYELWNMADRQRLLVLADQPDAYLCSVQDDSVFLVTPSEVLVLENCLSGF